MDDEALQAGFGKQFGAFFNRAEQTDFGLFLEHHPRMREKSQDQAFGIGQVRIVDEFFNDFLVAQMHAVKGAQRDYGFFVRAKIGDGLKNLQSGTFNTANLEFQIDI